MTSLGDLKEAWLERLDDLSDIAIKDIYVRKEMFHNLRRNHRNFYDSGKYDEVMTISKTKPRPQYEEWMYETIKPSLQERYNESDHDNLTSFMFDFMTKDDVTADDAREFIKDVQGGTVGTPDDEILDAVVNRYLSDEMYTMRKVDGDVKIYKGLYTDVHRLPDKRASRVADDMKEAWEIMREFSKNKGKPIFTIYEQEGFRGNTKFDTTLVRNRD